MQARQLGKSGPAVFPIGYGAMSLGYGDLYTSSSKDEASAIALVQRALDLGVTMIDTANVYGDSEIKVGKAVKDRRQKAVIATKFGLVGVAGKGFGVDGSPANARAACESSLKRLAIDVIDLYYLHRVDPNVAIEETIGAMADLVKQGKVRHIGLSEASAATIRRAHQVHPLAAVQSEYSLWTRDPEAEVLPALRELGIALVAYSPLGRGFLAGRFKKPEDLGPSDWRRGIPRFQGDNFQRNLALVQRVEALAKEKGCTPSQLALAWVLAQSENIVPIPGTSSTTRLQENVEAASVMLSQADLDNLERAVPKSDVAGPRYTPELMSAVNR